jgi:hypothetical protein
LFEDVGLVTHRPVTLDTVEGPSRMRKRLRPRAVRLKATSAAKLVGDAIAAPAALVLQPELKDLESGPRYCIGLAQ